MRVREILNVRRSGETLVVIIPESLLEAVPIKAGDGVLLSTVGSEEDRNLTGGRQAWRLK
jgi:antitoxin component of MazEF toxin-antitoxin module